MAFLWRLADRRAARLRPDPHCQRDLRPRSFDLAGGRARGLAAPRPGDDEEAPQGARRLEAKVAQEGLVLTEGQLAALEKAKSEKEAHGEFESECPGYC